MILLDYCRVTIDDPRYLPIDFQTEVVVNGGVKEVTTNLTLIFC